MFTGLEEYVKSLDTSVSVRFLLNIGIYFLETIVIIVLGVIIASISKRFIHKIAATWRANISDRKTDTLEIVLISLTRYAIVFFVVCSILGVFDVPIQSILAVAGVGSVAIGFGAQSLVKDFITGFFILLEDQFGVGDLVTLEGKTGTVESIGMRITCIRSFDGDVHIFPNSQIKYVTNLSKSYKRAIVDIKVPYDCDIDKVLGAFRDEMSRAKDSLPAILSDPVVLGITELKDNSINIKIIADCQVGESYAVERELRRLLVLRQERDGIGIPYPQFVLRDGAK